jgi:hypothetical protein
MIKYNFNYRGPFEYDKFILNALQLHNVITMFSEKKFEEEDPESLLSIQKKINELFNIVMEDSISKKTNYILLKVK